MSKEKQIEEIHAVIMWAELGFPKANLPLLDIEKYIAEAIYNAGYRKQSEWIGVDERLPEIETPWKGWGDHRVDKSVRVLCVCRQNSGKVLVKEGYYELFDFNQNPTWRIPGSIDSVTHWMPLPEPPKMKGGDDHD